MEFLKAIRNFVSLPVTKRTFETCELNPLYITIRDTYCRFPQIIQRVNEEKLDRMVLGDGTRCTLFSKASESISKVVIPDLVSPKVAFTVFRQFKTDPPNVKTLWEKFTVGPEGVINQSASPELDGAFLKLMRPIKK
jgi:hypothetical protein